MDYSRSSEMSTTRKKFIFFVPVVLIVLGLGGWFFLFGPESENLDLGFSLSTPGEGSRVVKKPHLQQGDMRKNGRKGEKGFSSEVSGEARDAPRKKLDRPKVPALLEVRVFAGFKKKKLPAAGAKVFLFEKAGMNGKAWKERDRVFAENPGLNYVPGSLRKRSKCFVTSENGSAFLPVKRGGPFTSKSYGNLIWAESRAGRPLKKG